MNWYRNQLNKEAKGMWTAFGWLTIPAIAVLLGGSVIDIAKKIKENLLQQINVFSGQKKLHDDYSLIVIKAI